MKPELAEPNIKMRYLLIMWALPVTLFGSWYGLSAHDINFGYFFLSRQMHDFFFQMYANTLGVSVEVLPGMILSAVLTDTVLVFGIVALRARKSWWPYVAPFWAPVAEFISPATEQLNKHIAQPLFRIKRNLSGHPWSIRLAAIWSTFAARFRRDTSAAIISRSVATVDIHSSGLSADRSQTIRT